jgi:hypothetical protein
VRLSALAHHLNTLFGSNLAIIQLALRQLSHGMRQEMDHCSAMIGREAADASSSHSIQTGKAARACISPVIGAQSKATIRGALSIQKWFGIQKVTSRNT